MQKLGAIAAPIVASVPGFSNPVSARGNDVRAKYQQQATMKAAFEKHANGLVEGLAKRGVLETSSVRALLVESETKVTAVQVGLTRTAHLEANKELPSGEILWVFVQP